MKQSESHIHVADLLDEEISALARHRAEQHLEQCDSCRREWEILCALRTEARSLPRGMTPPRDLWSGIAARLDEQGIPALQAKASRQKGPWLGRGMMAAAAIILVVVSSATTAWVLRQQPGSSQAPVAVAGQARPTHAVPALVAFRPAEAEYLRAAEDLRTLLETRRDALDPRTVAVVETNLAIIDRAIVEARGALEADPNSRELAEMLSSAHRQKVELLEKAVQLPAQI